jgi:general secretion pathway protein M
MALADKFSARERRLLSLIGVVLGALLVAGLPIGLELMVRERRDRNNELRQALADVQDARIRVRERASKKDAIASRYAKTPPSLASFIEQAARAEKLEVSDSNDHPAVPIGKMYSERSTVVHLKKAGMYAIAKFLERIEQSGNAVSVTRLNIRKRGGEPDSFDVEVGVSAYDRQEPKKPAAPEPEKDKKP